MKIGIIGAMEEEIRLLQQQLDNKVEVIHAGFTFYQGKLANREVVLVRSGIGKVNATISATLLVNYFKVDVLINTGSAGGLQEGLQVGDLVVANSLRYHDVDVTAFGYEKGQMAQMPASYSVDHRLMQLALKLCEQHNWRATQGLIVSGDQFVQGGESLMNIQQSFPQALACEMESAAVAQAAHVLQVPCLIIRAISDLANEEANISFDEFILKAGQQAAILVKELVSGI